MAEQGLKDKTVKGVGWSAIDNVAQFAVSFIVGVVLARLLTPDDYGLIGIITIFMALCNTLVNGGFSVALIRKNDVTEEDYNTAFVVNLGMSALLYAIVFFCAPLISLFFGRCELTSLSRVCSLNLIIGALAIVQQTRLTKKIDFKSQTKITIIASVVSGFIGISMALCNFGVWSLVAQQISSQIIKTCLLWRINKWIPKISFSYESFHGLFGFGWKILVSWVLSSIWEQMNRIVVGKYYSPATLGQYTRAENFSSVCSTNLNSVIQRVTFPVLSALQDNWARMIEAYRKVIKVTMFITFLSMFVLGAVSRPLIYCLIGEQWAEAASFLPYICVAASLYPLHSLNLNMIQVLGRSDIYLYIEILKKIVCIPPIVIGIIWGVVPMLVASIITNIICFFLNSFFPGKELGYSSWMQIKDITPSFCIAISVAIPIYFFSYLPFSNWAILPMQLLLGLFLTILLCRTLRIEEYQETISIIKQLSGKFKQ